MMSIQILTSSYLSSVSAKMSLKSDVEATEMNLTNITPARRKPSPDASWTSGRKVRKRTEHDYEDDEDDEIE